MTEITRLRLRELEDAIERWMESPLPRAKADHELLRAWAAYKMRRKPATRVERSHAGICVDEEG